MSISPAASFGDHGSHGFHLMFEPVYQLGAVASVDEQHFVAWREDSAALLDPQPSAGALGVDHGDATGADCDVVDVRAPATGDPAIVQQHDVAAAADVWRVGGRRGSLRRRLASTRGCCAALRSVARGPGRAGRGVRGRASRAVRVGARTRGPRLRLPTLRPLRTRVLAISRLTWLDVVGVDVGLAGGGWLGVVHGDRERFFGVHGDLGCVPVSVPDPVGRVGW